MPLGKCNALNAIHNLMSVITGVFSPLFAGRVHILEDRSLRLDNVTMDDSGEYSCEADNAVGAVTATGILTVFGELKYLLSLTLSN